MRRQRWLGVPVLLALAWVIQYHAASAQVNDVSSDISSGQASANSSTIDPALSASEVLARMENSRGGIRKLLEDSRKQRDVIKTLCVDDKLSQIDIALRYARERKNALETALRKNDPELAQRERAALDVHKQRADELVAEANQCVSREVDKQEVGPASLNAFVDPNIADDPAYYPPGIIIIEPPPTGSVIK